MPTNPNIIAIQTVTVGAGGAASIDFTSIPATYTDLLMKISTRSTVGGTGQDDINVTFNGSTSSYSWRNVLGSGSSAISQNGGSSNIRMSAVSPNAGTASSTFSNAELYIPNYAGSNNKSVSIDMVSEANQTATYMGLVAGLWSNSSAITQITLTGASGNFAQYSTATVYGVTSAAYGAKATGGIIYEDGTYYYHTFLSSGTFTPTQSLSADILVVAGGGAGGSEIGGGGGAGGLLTFSSQSLTATGYTVTVGAGAAQSSGTSNGANGSDSQFGALTLVKGGGGGGFYAQAGIAGGSGGGGGRTGLSGGGATSGQGFGGGVGQYPGGTGGFGGGGGGAGAVGENAPTNRGGNGGIGATSSLINAMGAATGAGRLSSGNYYFAGGGGGGGESGGSASSGGIGGGGAGGYGGPAAGSAGTVNTGGGGGAGGGTGASTGGAGGSGIVIVRYAK